MADFPSLPQGHRSSWEPDAGNRNTVTMGGAVRTRRLYTSPVYSGTIVVQCYSESDRTTLEDFYAANRDIEFTFTYDADPSGVTYTCRFMNSIQWEWHATDWIEAFVEMSGKRD